MLGDGMHVLAAAPIAVWELSLGLYLVAKGFKPAPITADRSSLPQRDFEGVAR